MKKNIIAHKNYIKWLFGRKEWFISWNKKIRMKHNNNREEDSF